MKVGCLGTGAWGSCLANLLAKNGHTIRMWEGRLSGRPLALQSACVPYLHRALASRQLSLCTKLRQVVEGTDLIVESVTSQGFREVIGQLSTLNLTLPPLLVTSKGIEHDSGLLLCEVASDVLGEAFTEKLACLSGPSLADEVNRALPTSVVCASNHPPLIERVQQGFSTPYFHIHGSQDVLGVSLGGAIKNVIAIACAIADGLGFAENTRGMLLTQGLEEMRQLVQIKGGNPETLVGLSGVGDLIATCLSKRSRNHRFGQLIAEGYSIEEAEGRVGMVVEGMYSCLSAIQLGRRAGVKLPVIEAVYDLLYCQVPPREAMESVLLKKVQRREESLLC